MHYTLKYHLSRYKMLEYFRAVLAVDTFFPLYLSWLVSVGIFYLLEVSGNTHSYCIEPRAYFRKSELFQDALRGVLLVWGTQSSPWSSAGPG